MSEIDTLNIYEELKDELGEGAAKKLARVIKQSVENSAATKGDLRESEARLRNEIQTMGTDLRREMANTNLRVAGMMLAQIGLIVALMKLLS